MSPFCSTPRSPASTRGRVGVALPCVATATEHLRTASQRARDDVVVGQIPRRMGRHPEARTAPSVARNVGCDVRRSSLPPRRVVVHRVAHRATKAAVARHASGAIRRGHAASVGVPLAPGADANRDPWHSLPPPVKCGQLRRLTVRRMEGGDLTGETCLATLEPPSDTSTDAHLGLRCRGDLRAGER